MKTIKNCIKRSKENTFRTQKQCLLKDGDHKNWMCTQFKQQRFNEKHETLQKWKPCFRCSNSHLTKNCKSNRNCAVNGCPKNHNKRLHSDSPKIENDKKSEKSVCSMLPTGGSSFLQLLLNSFGNGNRIVETIVLCDIASTVSFMDQTLVDYFKLKRKEYVISLAGIFELFDLKIKDVTARIRSTEKAKTAGEDLTLCSHPNLSKTSQVIGMILEKAKPPWGGQSMEHYAKQ